MRGLPTLSRFAGTLALGCLLGATQARAQNNTPQRASADTPGVHTMTIINGTTRTTHYFAPDASRQEQEALRDLERAENELALSDQLQNLRRSLLAFEAAWPPHMRSEQSNSQNLFGTQSSPFLTSTASQPGGFANAFRAQAGTGLDLNGFGPGLNGGVVTNVGGVGGAGGVAPGFLGSSFFGPLGGGFNGLLNGLGMFGGPLSGAVGPQYLSKNLLDNLGLSGAMYSSKSSTTTDPTIDSRLKTELASSLAAQGTPESRAHLMRTRDVALARVGESDRLAKSLNLRPGAAPTEALARTNAEPNARTSFYSPNREVPVTITLKSGDKIKGTLRGEDKDRLVVDAGNEVLEIRRDETRTISYPKPAASEK